MRRSTWIILLIAVVLLAATLFWQRTKSNLETTTEVTPVSGSELEFSFNSAQVSEIVIQDAEGSTVILNRGVDGFWELEQPEAEMTNSQVVENALSQLLSLNTVTRISSQTPLEDLGLDPPAYRLLLRLEDGGEMVINVGNVTPTGSGYYMLTSSENRALFVVGKFNLETILNLILTPPIMTPTPAPEFTPPATEAP